jgi:hypothetical protein
MGNIILRHKRDGIVKMPEMKKLTLDQINLIQSTWALPNQKVSELLQNLQKYLIKS